MLNKIFLEVVTPDKFLISKEVDIVVATGTKGEFGVLAGHMPFFTTLAIGELRYRDSNIIKYAAIGGGFCEITASKILILTESAELTEDIDIDRAKRAQEKAKQLLLLNKNNKKIEAALHRALIRIKVAERSKIILKVN